MNKLIFSVLFAALTSFVMAQTQLPNVGFESWDAVGSAQEEPSNWNSNKTGGGNASSGPQTCFRDGSVVYNGTYSARIETVSYLFGIIVNGSMTTGRIEAPSTNPLDGYTHTIPSNPSFSSPFTARPDSLIGYYRYSSASGDQGKIECILHDSADFRTPIVDSSKVVGNATFFTPTSSVTAWTRFAVPFNYWKSGSPAYVLVTSTSSAIPGGGTAGSTLWLDDLQVVYRPAIALGTVSPASPYYVSNTVGANLSVPYNIVGNFDPANIYTVELSDASGSFASPVAIGNVTANSNGTISATIPAGTASGTNYRLRISSSNPAVVSDSSAAFSVNFCDNPVSPTALQTLAANTNGTTLTVSETVTASSREWKFATTSGGPYSSFAPTETGTTYTPNFAVAGTYYLVCQSNYPGGLQVVSNEVQIDVVANSVSPSSAQSILVGANGNMLTVTESPAGTAREWKFATTSGGPYSSFAPTETGTTYTPNFAAAGTYYVICESTISALQAISNEVVISVGSTTISTGTISGSPFEFSPSAPAAAVSVPFTVNAPLNAANTFSAELSDASGSFANPTVIGTLSGTNSGTISASIPNSTPAGTAYRIRVVADDPVVTGSDNGSNFVVDQFNNSISPTTTQTVLVNTNGTAVNVMASQSATHEWKFATTSGGPYSSFATAETNASYTPNFSSPGTYYVVCESMNQYNDVVISGELTVVVNNGSQLSTTSVSNNAFYISPSANETATVNFSSNAAFNASNVFTVELSDANGSFSNPTAIGSLASTTVAPISVTIPNSILSGTAYRVRVVSSDPVLTGTDNGSNLAIAQFASTIAPADTQFISVEVNGNPVTVTTNHPGATHEWKWRPNSFAPYSTFSPAETNATYTPNFATVGGYKVVAFSVNSWGDTIQSGELIVVTNTTAIETLEAANVLAYWHQNELIVDLSNADLRTPATIELYELSGRQLWRVEAPEARRYQWSKDLPAGIYLLNIRLEGKNHSFKLPKKE
jgi:plastocyanin